MFSVAPLAAPKVMPKLPELVMLPEMALLPLTEKTTPVLLTPLPSADCAVLMALARMMPPVSQSASLLFAVGPLRLIGPLPSALPLLMLMMPLTIVVPPA